jgi:large subunit ribosomal protein L13
MNKTETIKKKDVTRTWHLVDASSAPLGRMTTSIATLLIGKNKVSYSPNIDCGDYVVVINATGRKETTKIYYSYSGYPSGLKALRLEEVRARGGVRIV